MNNIGNMPSPPHTNSTVFTIVFLVVVSHSGCNIHIIETLQSVPCSSGFKTKTIKTATTAEGSGGVYDRDRRVSVINVLKCVVGFTANPTGGAGLVGGGRGSLGREDSW